MINNYDDLISRYIEDDLNKEETASFEKYMNSNNEFSKKVYNIKNNISLYQNLPKIDTSKDFLTNLDSKINNKYENKFWWISDFKTALPFVFSFIILFFIAVNYGPKDNDYLANQSKSEQNLIDTKIDSLKNEDFEITRVNSSKSIK